MSKKRANDGIPQMVAQNIGDAELASLFYPGDGPPLVFLHATGFLSWLWHPVARELAGDYRIYAPNFCAHRSADPEKGGLDWKTLAEDLALFCERLQLEKPFLVGHSMGATVAVIANALHGLRAAGMVLIEPIILPPELYRMRIGVEQHPLAAKAIRRTNHWKNRDEASAYLHSLPLFLAWEEEMLGLYLRHGMSEEEGGLRLTCSPLQEAALFMGGMRYDPWPLLSRISAPVLILEGEKSDHRELIDLGRVRNLIPDCAYHLVEGAGHLIPMERPKEVTRLIRGFLGSVQSRERSAMGSDEHRSAV